MSSHHIVRDQQEPALIIQNLNGFPKEVLHGLLEWSPTVVCYDEAIEEYTKQGHKLDVALINQVEWQHWFDYLSDQQPLKIIGFPDREFLPSGLMFLQREHHRAVNIVTREPELEKVLSEVLKWAQVLDIVVFTETEKYLLIKSQEFKKWVPANTEIFAISPDENSVWSNSGFDMEESVSPGKIHLVKHEEGQVVVRCNSAVFVIAEKN